MKPKASKPREYLKHVDSDSRGIITEGFQERWEQAFEDLNAGLNLREAIRVVHATNDEKVIAAMLEVYGSRAQEKSRKGERLRHPTLGLLTHDGDEFVGRYKSLLYPRSAIKVTLDPALSEHNAIASLWTQFRRRERMLRSELETSIFNHHGKLPEEVKSPAVKRAPDIWGTLGKPEIFFQPSGRKVKFGLYWSPDWEPEHGLYVHLTPQARIHRIGEL